jgi:putative Mn2+ efflux pump MntP
MKKTRILPWILTAVFSICFILQLPEALNSGQMIFVVMAFIGNAIIPAIGWIITYFVEKRIQQRENNAQISNNNSNTNKREDKPGLEQIFAIIPLVGWIMAFFASKYSKKKADRYLLLSIIGLVLGILYKLSK